MFLNYARNVYFITYEIAQILNGQEQFQKTQEKMQNNIIKIQKDMDLIKTQQKEHGQILSALNSASKVHKADVDNLTHQVAELQSTVKNLSNEMS